jgi:ligand-binding SRPBCC domain-containing protein
VQWQPGVRFVDLQLRGPYLLWRHRHDFEPRDGGVVVRDTIDYALPLAPLSAPALPMVRADVRRIFGYRREQMSRLFR